MDTKTFLYVGYVGYQNLGDDALKQVFVEEIKAACLQQGLEAKVVTCYPLQFREADLLELHPDVVVLGGGSILTPGYVRLLRLAQKHGIPTAVWGSGIDRLSKQKLQQVQQGQPPPINQGLARPLRQALNQCRLIGVRGPHTKRVLESAGVSPEKIEVIGDPGLLVKPLERSKLRHDPLDLLKDCESIIACNWGTTRNRLFGGSESYVASELEIVLRELGKEHGLLLFPMWVEDTGALTRLVSQLQDVGHLAVADRPVSAPALASTLQRCRYSINFKLHANIFSAAAGTPFVALGYRSKCFDFLASIQALDLAVSTDTRHLSRTVLNLCAKINSNYNAFQRRIEQQRDLFVQRLTAFTKKLARLE